MGTHILNIARPHSPEETEIMDVYWRFAVNRQNIFFRRLHGESRPWTSDAILTKHKFTNAYRVLDRTSQFLITDVINNKNRTPTDIFFRILLFKIFNKIETWQLLTTKLGDITFSPRVFESIATILLSAMSKGIAIYSAAYIMPTRSADFRHPRKHYNHLKLLEMMIRDELPNKLSQTRTMQQGYNLLRSYPMIGDFLAYQFITDINYSTLTDYSEMEFVVPGPGAKDGIRKCFKDLRGHSEADAIRYVCEKQSDEFARLGLDFKSLGGRPLQLIDCQNLFCEVAKYTRVSHPNFPGISGRTRIKQIFTPKDSLPKVTFPKKWGIDINDYQLSRKHR